MDNITEKKKSPWYLKLRDELINIKGSPHEIAKSFAVGIIVGIVPGTGPVAAVFLAFIFRLNKPATLIGSLLTNTWTTVFFYAGSYTIGELLSNLGLIPIKPVPLDFKKGINWKSIGISAVPIIIGGIILTLSIALVAYLIAYLAVKLSSRRQQLQK